MKSKIPTPHIDNYNKLSQVAEDYHKDFSKEIDAEYEKIRIAKIREIMPTLIKSVYVWCRDGNKYPEAHLLKGTPEKIIEHMIDCPRFQITERVSNWNYARQLFAPDEVEMTDNYYN